MGSVPDLRLARIHQDEGDAARLQLARELAQPAALVDGRAKLLLVREALRFRRAHGPLFLEGEYVPLVVEGRTIGGLTFSFGSDQVFDDDRRAMKITLARQAAQALERARLYGALSQAEQRMSFLAEASRTLATSRPTASTRTRRTAARSRFWPSRD